MTLESEVRDSLRHLRAELELSSPSQGLAAAEGIRKSGLLMVMEQALTEGNKNLASVALALSNTESAVRDGLSAVSRQLSNVLDTLSRPRETEAAELRERGARALRNGWVEEALEEFDAAIAVDRYDPTTHLLRALALRQTNTELDIVDEALKLATRYGAPESPDLAATALVMRVRLQIDNDEQEQARDLAKEGVNAFPRCAELLLLHAQLSDDVGALINALILAPEFYLIAAGHDLDAVVRASAEPSAETLLRFGEEVASLLRRAAVENNDCVSPEFLDAAMSYASESTASKLGIACGFSSAAKDLERRVRAGIDALVTEKVKREAEIASMEQALNQVERELGVNEQHLTQLSTAHQEISSRLAELQSGDYDATTDENLVVPQWTSHGTQESVSVTFADRSRAPRGRGRVVPRYELDQANRRLAELEERAQRAAEARPTAEVKLLTSEARLRKLAAEPWLVRRTPAHRREVQQLESAVRLQREAVERSQRDLVAYAAAIAADVAAARAEVARAEEAFKVASRAASEGLRGRPARDARLAAEAERDRLEVERARLSTEAGAAESQRRDLEARYSKLRETRVHWDDALRKRQRAVDLERSERASRLAEAADGRLGDFTEVENRDVFKADLRSAFARVENSGRLRLIE